MFDFIFAEKFAVCINKIRYKYASMPLKSHISWSLHDLKILAEIIPMHKFNA